MPTGPDQTSSSVDLYWLPLGAGDRFPTVAWSGRLYEVLAAASGRRARAPLFHSLLEVHVDGKRWVIEMAPVWHVAEASRTVVCEGAVGVPWLRRSRFFRYGVHVSCDGDIPDLSHAVGGPRRMSSKDGRAHAVLDLAAGFPTSTWGLDELHAGEMWNSNSLTSWLLARSGHTLLSLSPPVYGRAPGWSAGRVVAARHDTAASGRRSLVPATPDLATGKPPNQNPSPGNAKPPGCAVAGRCATVDSRPGRNALGWRCWSGRCSLRPAGR